MPRGDGTGPFGQGTMTGRGKGAGKGTGMGSMGGNRAGAGPGGNCVCPNCGEKVAHKPGVPCYYATCPKCGARMARE